MELTYPEETPKEGLSTHSGDYPRFGSLEEVKIFWQGEERKLFIFRGQYRGQPKYLVVLGWKIEGKEPFIRFDGEPAVDVNIILREHEEEIRETLRGQGFLGNVNFRYL